MIFGLHFGGILGSILGGFLVPFWTVGVRGFACISVFHVTGTLFGPTSRIAVLVTSGPQFTLDPLLVHFWNRNLGHFGTAAYLVVVMTSRHSCRVTDRGTFASPSDPELETTRHSCRVTDLETFVSPAQADRSGT